MSRLRPFCRSPGAWRDTFRMQGQIDNYVHDKKKDQRVIDSSCAHIVLLIVDIVTIYKRNGDGEAISCIKILTVYAMLSFDDVNIEI